MAHLAQDALDAASAHFGEVLTARNFTHYIKPGDRLISVDDTSSAAAVSKEGDAATVVHVNSASSARTVTVDLSTFRHVGRKATVTPIVTSAEGKLERHRALAVSDRKATFTVPAPSVTSFVVTGVSGVAKDAALLRKGHTYQLTGVHSGKALTVADNGSGLVIASASTDPAAVGRQCQLRQISGDTGNRQRYVFTNPVEGKRLAVRHGAPVLEADRGPRDRGAQWIMSTTGDSTWTLVNAATGRLLEVGGQATHDGAAVTVWEPNSGSHQRWRVTDVTGRSGPQVR